MLEGATCLGAPGDYPIWTGIGGGLAVASGLLLLMGFLNVCAYYFFRRRDDLGKVALPPSAQLHAIVSVTVWIGALFAGRAIAYF